jgi:hypothetical protein
MENLDLKNLNVSEITDAEMITIEGGCALDFFYEFWDGFKEGFANGAVAGSNFLR